MAAFQIGAFGLLLYALWRLTRAATVPLAGWLLAYSPATLLFSLFGLNEPGRKEVLLFALFALASVLLSERHRKIAAMGVFAWCAAILIGLTAAMVVLSHEMTIFYMPWLMWLCWLAFSSLPIVRRLLLMFVLLAIPLMAFGSLMMWGGALERQLFCRSFMDAGLSASICQGVLTFPIDDLAGSYRNTLLVIDQFDYVKTYGLGLVLLLVPVFWTAKIERFNWSGRALAGVLLCVLWSAPLFFVAVDWGRFIQIHVLLGLMLWLAAQRFLPQVSGVTPSSIPTRLSWSSVALVVLGWISLGLWNLPVCCEAWVGTGIVGHVWALLPR